MRIVHCAKRLGTVLKISSFEELAESVKGCKRVKKRGSDMMAYNIPCSFDIETYSNTPSVDEDGLPEVKKSNMYAWTFGINHSVAFGRRWDEFKDACACLTKTLELSPTNVLVVYVHNLAYEFAFIQKLFDWDEIFAVDKRKVVMARTTGGIEFRCSYILTGKNLAQVGEEIKDPDIKKMVGDLDYTLPRHSDTPMTDEEILYCVNDVRIVMAKIQQCIDDEGSILKIPKTNTGYVRRYMKNTCLQGVDKYSNRQYQSMMTNLSLDVDEYKLAREAFMGGFTHANATHVRKVQKDVASRDLQSSYPAVMCAYKYPMSKGYNVDVHTLTSEQFKNHIENKCCLMQLHFTNIRERWNSPDNIISSSKCRTLTGNTVLNNGRVVHAEELVTTCTEIDLQYYKKFYEWDSMKVLEMWVYKKDYLPTQFVNGILKLYVDKTTLKGVEGSEDLYMLSKGMLNSTYGMCATDIGKARVEFDPEIEGMWKESATPLDERIADYNCDRNRFISYLWGVWTTAHARARLYEGILHLGEDYIYSDTDSVKYLNKEKHELFFEEQNRKITVLMDEAMNHHNIDIEKTRPCDKKGNKRQMGIWEDETSEKEGLYEEFKTLGAKRYMVKQHGKMKITVSGIRKSAVGYLKDVCSGITEKMFDMFDDGMYVPADKTGKLTHFYIDHATDGVLVDYTGLAGAIHEETSVHLSPQDFRLSMNESFIQYITNREVIV